MQKIRICGLLLLFLVTLNAFAEAPEHRNVWTIRVNSETINKALYIYGLWKPKKVSSKDLLFFGIFDDQKIMENALGELKKLDDSATPQQLDSYPSDAVFIPVAKSMTLADLGYRLPIQIRGIQGTTRIHIPWTQNMSLKNSKGVFYITFPQGIFQKPSTLTVYVENRPIKVVALDQTFKSPLIVDFPEIDNANIGDFLDITLTTSITITGDKCVDDQTGNAWIILEPTSFFEILYYPVIGSFYDALKNPLERLNLFLPSGQIKHEELTGLFNFASLIGAIHSYRTDSMFTSGGYSLKSPNIILKEGAEDAKIIGRDIVISPQGLSTMARNFSSPSMSLSNWNKVQVLQDEKDKTAPEKEIKFSDLGIIPPILRGIGDLQFSIPFSIASFGNFPSRVMVTIIYHHTPIAKEDRAFIKVRLNGVLVASKLITSGESKEESFSFELPSRFLQTRNTLDVTFSYFTNRGECKGSFPDMEVSVSPDSFFTVIGTSFVQENFDTFPGLLSGEGLMILGESSSNFVNLAMELTEKLGKLRQKPLFVRAITLDNFSENSVTPFTIAVLKASQTAIFDPLVNTSEQFLIKNPQTGQTILDVNTNDNVGVWQVFRGKNKTIVGMLSISDSIANSISPTEFLKGLRMEGSANVAVWTQVSSICFDGNCSGSEWRNFEVGEKMQVVMPGKKGISYYWTKYRVYGFLILGVLLFLFLWYVYRKLT